MSELESLRAAIMNGNKENIMKILSKEEVDIKVTDDDGNTFLHLALKNDNFDEVQLIEILEIFLDCGIDIDAKNAAGKTVLHLAIERRLRNIIDFLIQRGADLKTCDEYGNTIAHFVIKEECRKLYVLYEKKMVDDFEKLEDKSSSFVNWIASKEIDFYCKKNHDNHSALYLANALNLQHILFTLLKRIKDLESVENSQTPLLCKFLLKIYKPFSNYENLTQINPQFYKSRHICNIVEIILKKNQSMDAESLNIALNTAINLENLDVIKILLQRVPTIELDSIITDFTNLYMRWEDQSKITEGIDIIKILLRKGGNINSRYIRDTCAQALIRRQTNFEMLQIVKEGRADFRQRAYYGQNILHIISQQSNDPRLIDLIAKDCGGLDMPDRSKQTPLYLAIICNNSSVAIRLIELGAKTENPNTDNVNARSMLNFACTLGQVDVVDKLIEYGGNMNYRNIDGETLLHISKKQPKVVETLLTNGADVHAKDKHGKTPLHCSHDYSVIKLLYDAGAHLEALDNLDLTPLHTTITHGNLVSVKELIKCGANLQNPKVFQLLLHVFSRPGIAEESISQYCKRLIVKLIAVDFYDKATYVPKGIVYATFQKFFEKCLIEVELLKNFFIDDRTSLYNLFRMSQNHRCDYLENEDLKNLVEDAEIKQKFPNYFVLILGCYNEARTKKPFLDSALHFFNKFTEVSLPSLCLDKILFNLSDVDLRSIKICFDELNKSINEINL